MKISTNSWHYKMIIFMDFDPARNLCTYFWQVVGTCLLWIGAAIFAPMFAIVLLAPFINIFVPISLPPILLGGGIDIAILCLVWHEYRQTHISYEYKEPTLIGAWVRAKKEKVCPLIEFK